MPPCMILSLLNAYQLREDIKVQGDCPCRCTLRLAVSRTPNHRPHPLSVQWLPLRHSCTVYGPGPEQLDTLIVWSALCSSSVPQAHILVPRTCLLRLPFARLLLRTAVVLPVLYYSVLQLRQVGSRYRCCLRSRVRSIRDMGANTASVQSLVPILAGSMSCVLGAKRLGDVFVL